MSTFVAASSSIVFIFPQEQNMYLNTPPSWSSWNYLSNEPSYAWNGFRTRELCQFYSGNAIYPKWFQRATLNVSVISPLRVLKIDDSWCVGKNVWRSFWILAFLSFYIS
jgi:hypothetical protein